MALECPDRFAHASLARFDRRDGLAWKIGGFGALVDGGVFRM